MPIETIIHTLRHAQTVYNGQKRYAGTLDVTLSDAGRFEAQQAAALLGKPNFDVVVTSKLRRTYETAQILVGDSVPIVQTELCNERNFGIMEGLTWEEVQQLDPPVLMIEVGSDLHTVNPKRGEPFEKVWDRAKSFRRLLFKNYKGSRILVVSHGVFLQFFHGLLRGLSCIESLAAYPSNLQLTRFRFSGHLLVQEDVYRLAAAKAVTW